MPVKTLAADRSSLFALNNANGLALGGGQEAHLPIINNPGGYNLRAAVGFTFPPGFFDDMRKVTGATLTLTNTPSTAHVGKGASGLVFIYRATSQWTANGAGESWTTAPTVYGGPGATAAGGGGFASDPTASLAQAFGIVGIFMAWAPNTVHDASGNAGLGAVCYGVSLQESGGAAQACEFVSALGAARPFLTITYESNAPPNAPTLITPLGPNQAAGKFEAQAVDPEADPITAYDLQVSTDASLGTVTHWNVAGGTSGLTAAGALSVVYGGTAMVNGTRYYWRTRMRDAGAYGPWSTTATFVKVAAGGPTADLYDQWMDALLADLSAGRTVLRIGTLRPQGEQVADLVTGEYGELYTLYWDEVSPVVDEGVYLLGQSVTLGPDGWAVDAVLELAKEAPAIKGAPRTIPP